MISVNEIQQNSTDPTHTGQAMCQAIKYSTLSDSTYTDLISYRELFLALLYWGCTSIRGAFLLDISSPTGSGSSWSSCVSGVFNSWRLQITWRSKSQGFRRYHNWCTDTLGGLSDHILEICLFHWWRSFLVKSKTSDRGTTLIKCHINRHQIKGILLYYETDAWDWRTNMNPKSSFPSVHWNASSAENNL